MLPALQALITPLLAPLLAAIEARFTLVASLVIRRAVFLIAAALCGVGTLLFLSVGIFFALLPAVGPAGAALVMAVIWAMLTVACVLLARARPRVPAAAAPVALPVSAAPPAATYPAAHPAHATYPPPPAAGSAVPPTGSPHAAAAGVPPVSPVAPASRLTRLRTRVSRAAPLLAIGALVAGIIAGRR